MRPTHIGKGLRLDKGIALAPLNRRWKRRTDLAAKMGDARANSECEGRDVVGRMG